MMALMLTAVTAVRVGHDVLEFCIVGIFRGEEENHM